MAASLCLGLLLIAVSSIEAQQVPSPISTSNGVSNTTLYFQDLDYDPTSGVENSGLHTIYKGVIEDLLGTTLIELTITDGGGCTRMAFKWSEGDIAAQTRLLTTTVQEGILFFGVRLLVNLQGCNPPPTPATQPSKSTSSPEPTISDQMSSATLFISGMTYTAELNNSNSESFISIKSLLQTLLAPTGVILEDIGFADGGGCLKVWLQMSGGNILVLTELLTGFERTGITILGNMFNASSTQCPDDGSGKNDHQLEFKLHIAGLPWEKSYEDQKSPQYQLVQGAVMTAFRNLGGNLHDMEIVQSGDCVVLLIQWRLANMDEKAMNLVQGVVDRGLKLLGQVHTMDTNVCPTANVTVDLCNFFPVDPCGVNGRCVGNSPNGREWEMCSCNPGFGGLFCENNNPDNLTECERMRRFNLFIHNHMNGSNIAPLPMNSTMRVILERLNVKEYSLPFCLPASVGTRNNFYSSCDYDAANGQKLQCRCLSGNGDQNFWQYNGEADCRVYSQYLSKIQGELYIHNLAWSQDLYEDSNFNIKTQIERHMSPAGGYISELEFFQWGLGGCVRVHLVYMAERGIEGRTLLYSLPGSSLMVKNESKTVSLFPCKEDIDVSACPKPQPGFVGICLYECGAGNPCEDGRTCCNNECGGGICRELGFLQKMEVTITLQTEFLNDYEREGSLAHTILKENVINSVTSLMSSNNIEGFKSVKVLGFKSAMRMSAIQESHGPKHRKRRQAPEVNTLILLEFLFTKEVPVDKLTEVKEDLLKTGIDFASTNYVVLGVGLGKEGQCGDVECFYGSICVERLGGQAQCACQIGRAGRKCQLKVCHNPDGSSMCQNNAQCQYDDSIYGYRCHCEAGFHGKYCETNVCELFKPDACNEGTCVGDVSNMTPCRCPPGKGGLFCQYNVQPSYNQTYCERHHAFATYVVSVLNGSNPGHELSVNVSQLFPLFNSTRDILMLPTCRYDNPSMPGEYHFFCGYDTRTGQRSLDQGCLCTNGDGGFNYWTFHNGQCVVYLEGERREAPCEKRPCANGGICHNMADGDFNCACPPGFHGATCLLHHRDQCPHGGAPLYKSFGLWTCGDDRPCPVGFHCHGSSLNGSCCFKPDFLCDLQLCQNGASCMGDLHSGQICSCPSGKTGLFCDKDDDGVKLTRCQKQQQLMTWLENMLRTGTAPPTATLDDIRQILIHIGITYIPTDMCDEDGAFKTSVESISVLNVKDVRNLCFTRDGDFDPLCKDEICDTVEDFGICMNGGRCIGDITRAFCDCTGTGFHGPRCDSAGEGDNMTECMQVRELVQFALKIANGSVQIFPGIDISGAVLNLFKLTQIPAVFEPYCDDYGRYAYKGCAHLFPNLTEKRCYCTSEDLQQVGDVSSIIEPPENCPMGPDQCPRQWGPECERPDWWCTHEKKCKEGEEKCYFAVDCDEEECSKTPKISCVPEELKLPCEPQPCKHDRYRMCPPCGEEASCFHINRGDFDSEDKDDNGQEGMNDKYDDNDSEEKRGGVGKPDDDNDSGEDELSWMKPTKGQNYICECPMGRSGPNCQVHDEVCNSIPPQLCPHGCVGDLEHGVLCRCPEGYAGLTCEKVARTPCEIKEAFYGDSLNVLRGLFDLPGFDSPDLKRMVQFLVSLTGGDSIPETNCTENGFYEKVQCDINVYDMDQKKCYCVNQRGDYVASNILPHIGYEACTGPLDMRTMVGLCFRQDLQICQNGGSCVFHLYEGKICDCPPGFYGQFCEKEGATADGARSFCEFMRDSFSYVQDMLLTNGTIQNVVAQRHLYEILSSFIDINSNRTTNGHIHGYVALKMECEPDGDFKYYACDHDLLTNERIACYCLGHDGPLIGTEAPNPESLDCSDARSLACHELDDCPYLECEHGHRHNLQYCPICECRQPCEGHKCYKGERCVVQEYDCDNKDEKCTNPVCVSTRKPGVCPGHKAEDLRESLMSNLSNPDNDICQVKCHDDADCEGSMKCCGLCGNMCVEPEESDDCEHQYDLMMEYLEFITESRNLSFSPNISRSLLRTVDQVGDVNEIWVPRCRDSNYLPVQCMYNVSALLRGNRITTECFCVDRLGHRIKHSEGDIGDETSCDVKPFSCPTLHPSTGDDAADECSEDMDCSKSSKCCHDGFHHVCSEPVPEPADEYAVNIIMDNICGEVPDICPSGSCTSNWELEGKVCDCSVQTMGPFCELPVTGEMVKPRTACERKRLTTYLFWTSFEKIMTANADPQTFSTVDVIIQRATDALLDDVPEHEHEKIPIVMYECDDGGNYEPVQCDLSLFTEKKLECFCVDDDGKELPGTRRLSDEQVPFCRREKTCEMGHALRQASGSVVTCDKYNPCPYGYNCARGMYGMLYCCPKEEEQRDICNHPVNPGFECEASTAAVNYYYRADTDSCESFNFKGCGGNRNRFESMDDCLKRCKDKVHFGSCPSTPFEVAKSTNCNQNHCQDDTDCPSDRFKCCNSTCGKRCIPAIDESPAEGHCPVGLPKSDPESCEYSEQCGPGYRCHFKEDDVSNLYRSGYCCLDIRNLDYCRIKPLMMEKMKEDSYEEKDDSDEDGKDSSDEDDDDSSEEHDYEKDGSHDEREDNMLCRKPMPRYYYNHERSRCEMYRGCDGDFNTFESEEDCCRTCSSDTRCKPGVCPNLRSEIAVSCRDECVYDHDCSGRKICCNTGCSLNCVDPHDEMNSTCFAEQREAKKARGLNQRGDTCSEVYIPKCEENGEYARQQCHLSIGICWCVTSQGNYLNPSLTRGVASCHHYSEVDLNLADLYPESVHNVEFSVCPQDEEVHCCSENLCKKRCHAHPEAMCRINPCGGCSVEYFDADNNIVNCEEGLTSCQLELQNALRVISARSITAGIEEKENDVEEEEEKRREMSEQKFNDWGQSVRADIPLKCQKMPETGNCKGFMRQWFYNPQTRKCNMFIWGMCGGNANRFQTPKECYDECDVASNPCATVRCGSPTPECTLTYDDDCYLSEDGCQLQATCTERETNTNLGEGVFIPRCLSSGGYNYKQCHGHFCWCVNNNGEYVGGLSSNAFYGDLQCTASGPTADSVVNLPDCPANSYVQKPQHRCLKACSDKVCPGYPRAECVVDLCSESCTTMFEDEYGNVVDCEDDECKAFSFSTENRDQCSEGVLCDGGNVRNCPSTVCENARERLCPQNPCAVCMVDSCTCQPYFVDVMTSERLDPDSADCKYLSKGSCTAQTCRLMIDNVPRDQLPQCTSTGSFRAKQCHESSCYCVEAEGNFVQNISTNGNCEEIDEIAEIVLKLAFDGDFDSLRNQGKLSAVKDAVRNNLINEVGVPEANIYSISEPYRGSVAVDVVIRENNDDPSGANINLVANSISQKIQNDDFNIDVDGEQLGLIRDETVIALTPGSLVEKEDDDDDDGLSDKEIIIIAACGGGVAFLILIVVIGCCCCRTKKKPEAVDDTYDHIRERRPSDKNVYDNPGTMYNNKSFEAEGHYMDVQDAERYMKVRL